MDSGNYGDIKFHKLPECFNKYTKVEELNEMNDEVVVVRGRVQKTRAKGKHIGFVDMLDSGYSVRCIVCVNPEFVSHDMVRFAMKLNRESLIDVQGQVALIPKSIGETIQKVEIHVRKLYCLSRATTPLPFSVDDASRSEDDIIKNGHVRVKQDTRLNHGVIDMRTTANQAIFTIQDAVEKMFTDFLRNQGFRSIHTPKICLGISEGGSEVFSVDYFGKEACLAQSSQLYKQMAIFADCYRVFEMMDIVDRWLVATFDFLYETCMPQLDVINQQYCFDKLKYKQKTLRLTFEDGVQMLKEAGVEIDPFGDLNTDMERRLGQLILEKYHTEVDILYRYPLAVRPFYTMPCPDNPEYSNSLDVFIRGEEIISGGQRIHDPEFLTERAQALGIDVKTLQPFINSLRYGSRPLGGFGAGLERMVMLFLNLKNIRMVSMFPRDPKRISP